jgi:hypothetical protein
MLFLILVVVVVFVILIVVAGQFMRGKTWNAFLALETVVKASGVIFCNAAKHGTSVEATWRRSHGGFWAVETGKRP